MPRGRKKVETGPVEERIEIVNAEIEDLKVKIKEKKAELKALNAEKEEEDKEKLVAAVQASGMSYDQVISMLAEKKSSAE